MLNRRLPGLVGAVERWSIRAGQGRGLFIGRRGDAADRLSTGAGFRSC